MVKILFLHGFGQNPEEIRAKSASLQRMLPGCEFVFPSGSIRLQSYDSEDLSDRTRDLSEVSHRFAWNHLKEDLSFNLISLELVLEKLVPILEIEGPFDGVMGFSQGAAAASALASLLETRDVKIKHAAFKFAVLFCGARPTNPEFDVIYGNIKTPSLHYIGRQDVMVPTERSLQLCEAYESSQIFFHPGNHFIPQGVSHTRRISEFVMAALNVTPYLSNLEAPDQLIHKDVAQRVIDNAGLERKSSRKVRLIRRAGGLRVQMLIRA